MKFLIIRTALVKYVLFFLVIATSPWTWKLVSQSPLYLVLLGTMLICLIILENKKNIKLIYITLVLANVILVIFTLPKGVDKKIFSTTRLEKDTLAKRFEIYSKGLGRIYTNRFAIYYHYNIEPVLSKYSRNLFENMDINAYFFGSHPRENHNLGDYVKYTPLLLPFFVIGFIGVFINLNKIFLFFVVNLFLSALYSEETILGPFTLYPYLTIFILFGISLCIKKLFRN
jgi:hypothetical protein